jgi:hypothetical protein
MIIKFEKLSNGLNYQVVDPTWRGHLKDLLVHEDLE